MNNQSNLFVFDNNEDFFKKIDKLVLDIECNYIQNKSIIKK